MPENKTKSAEEIKENLRNEFNKEFGTDPTDNHLEAKKYFVWLENKIYRSQPPVSVSEEELMNIALQKYCSPYGKANGETFAYIEGLKATLPSKGYSMEELNNAINYAYDKGWKQDHLNKDTYIASLTPSKEGKG